MYEKSWCTPVLHFLISVVDDWQVLVEAVVGGVAGRVVDDGGVPAGDKTLARVKLSSRSSSNTTAVLWLVMRYLPLRRSSGGHLHCKLSHGALFQVLLLPANHVGLEGQDPLLTLPQALLERAHRDTWRLGLPLRVENHRAF